MVSITAARKSLCLRALGDVDHDNTDSDDLFVHPDRVIACKPVTPILCSGPLALDGNVDNGLTGLQHTAVNGLHLQPDVGDHLGDGAADLVLGRTAVDIGQSLIDANDAELAVDERKAHRRGRLERFHEGQ